MKKKKIDELEKLRLKYNYSYQQMADMLKISKSYYWQLEHNNRRIYYDLAIKIAKIFHKRPDEIFYDFFI